MSHTPDIERPERVDGGGVEKAEASIRTAEVDGERYCTPDIEEQIKTAIHNVTKRMSVRTGVKWQLQHTPYESEIDIVSDGRVLATVEAGEDKEGVAQMMVAAPDMLEALNNIIEHCEYERYPSCGEILRIAKYALKGVQ